MTYKPILKTSQLLFGTGTEIISLGWMPQNVFLEKLKKAFQEEELESKYCVIGGLTSIERGIPIMMQNILASGNIQQVWLVDDRVVGNSANYTLYQWWKREKDLQIPKFIPDWAIKKFRQNVCINFLKANQIINFLKSKNAGNTFEYWLTETEREELAQTFKKEYEKATKTNTLPSNIYNHTISAETETEAWLKILDRILRFGRTKPTGYEGVVKELIGLKVTISNPFRAIEDLEIPDFVPCSQEFLKDYFPSVLSGSNFNPNASSYTYGERIFAKWGDQVKMVVDKLKREPESQSAVINLWANERDNIKSKSPCLNHIWFSIYENRLYAHFTIRSNDMFSAWFANVCAFRQLQLIVANQLEIEAGEISTTSLSAHIYDDCFQYARETIEKSLPRCNKFNLDPCGYFVVEELDQDTNKFVVSLCHPVTNLVVHQFKGEIDSIVREVEQVIPQILPGNFLWLYKEMQSWLKLKGE